MGAYDGIFATSYRYPQFNPDRLTSQKGFDTADEMLTYPACRANFNLKRYAALADGWQIVPAVSDPMDARSGKAKEIAAFVNWCLGNIVSAFGVHQDFRSVLFEIMRGSWDGFKVSETGYEYQEEGPYAGRLGYNGFYHKPAKQIGFNVDPATLQVQTLTSYTPQTGYDFEVPVARCVLYTHDPQAGHPHGMGDWRACYKNWFVADNLTKFLAMALERWGAPVLIAKYPAGNKGAMDAAVEALNAIRQGAPAVLPNNVDYELVSVVSEVFDGFLNTIRFHNEQIAVNIQGNTLTTGAGQNSLALGEVHQDTGQTVIDNLKRDIESVVNSQIIKRLCRLNFANFDTSLLPTLSLGQDESTDRLKTAQMFQILVGMGTMWSKAKAIREECGVPPMDDDEQAQIDKEQKAQQEAKSQLADARNSGKVAPMSNLEVANALERLQIAIMAKAA